MPFVDRENLDPSQPLLKARWEQFCLEYIKDNNAGEAAKRVGYKHSRAQHMGSELCRSQLIGARLKYLQSKKLDDVEITVEWILGKIKSIVDANDSNNRDRLRGLELLGKNKALFTEKVEHIGLPKRIVIRNETQKVEEELA